MRLHDASAVRLAVVAALAGLVVTAGAQGPPAPRAGRTPRVAQEVRDRAARGGRVRVIVELARVGADVPTRLAARDHRVARRFRTVPYVALEVNAAGPAA